MNWVLLPLANLSRRGFKKLGRVIALWLAVLIGLNTCGPYIINTDLGGEDFKPASMHPLTYDPESQWTRQTKDKITVMMRYWAGTITDVPSKIQYPSAFEIGIINESSDPLAVENRFIYLSDGSKPLPEVDITPIKRTDFCTLFTDPDADHFSDCGALMITPAIPLVVIPCLLYDIPKCEHIYHKNLNKFNDRVDAMNNLMLHDTTLQPSGTADGWVYFNSLPEGAGGTLTISLRDRTTNVLETFVFNIQ